MEIVFSFNENNNEYLVIKNNKQYIPCKRINGIIKYEITNEELSLINYVFNKIKTTDNRIKLSNYEYKGIEYQHLYDKTNHYHIFLNIDGTEIDKNIFSELNMLFNYQSDILYINIDKKENRLKRLVNLGKKVILVLTTSTALISPLSKLTPVQAQEIAEYKTEIGEAPLLEISNEEKIENLKESMKTNKNLDDDNKEFFLSIFDIIYDNIDVLDYEKALENMNSLNIVKETEMKGYAEAYAPWSNTILLAPFTDDINLINTAKTHEFGHMLQQNNNKKGLIESHQGFYEPVNDILVNEYQGIKKQDDFRSYSWGYNETKPYIYALLEIIDPESLRYNNFTGDISKIKDELMSIIDDEGKFYELIGYYDTLVGCVYSQKTDYNIMNYTFTRLEKLLSEYYEKKYNSPMEENFEIMANLHKEAIKSIIQKDYPDTYVYDIKLDKIYFNNELKNEHSKSLIKVCDSYNKTIKYENGITENEEQIEGDRILDINDTCLKGKAKEVKKAIKEDKFENFKRDSYLKIDVMSDEKIELTYSYGSLTVKRSIDGNDYYHRISSDYIDKVLYKFLNKTNKISCSVYNNILSIYSNDEAYNIDLTTGKKVGLNRLIKIAKTNKEEVNNQIKSDIFELSKEDVIYSQNMPSEFEEDKLNKLIEISNNENIRNFNDNNIKTAHLNKNGNLVFNVKIKGVDTDNYKIDDVNYFNDEIIIGSPYYANEYLVDIKLLDLKSIDGKYNLHFENGELNITSIENNKSIFKSNSEYIRQIIQKLGMSKYKNIFINDNVLSISTNNESYNIDLKNEKTLSLEDLIKISNLTKEEVDKQIKSDLLEHTKQEIENLEKNVQINEKERSKLFNILNGQNIDYFNQKGIKTAYLDKDGNLTFNIRCKYINSENINDLSNLPDYKEQIIIGSPYSYEENNIAIKK